MGTLSINELDIGETCEGRLHTYFKNLPLNLHLPTTSALHPKIPTFTNPLRQKLNRLHEIKNRLRDLPEASASFPNSSSKISNVSSTIFKTS